MDDRRFDDLTRTLARAISRRAAITYAAGVLGALGLRGHTAAQVTQAQCGNTMCRNNPSRCTPGCVCCVYTNAVGEVTNSRCRPPGTCSPGTEISPTTQPPTTTTTTTTTSTTVQPTTTAAPNTTTVAPTTTTSTAPPGCVIDGVFFGPGALNPSTDCQSCQPAMSTSAWSARTGTACSLGGASGVCCADGQCCPSAFCSCCDGRICITPDLCRTTGDDVECR